MATYIGKVSDMQEIAYINRIVEASGATQKQFVRAALLAYCGMLLEKAVQLKESADATGSGDVARNLEQDTRENTDSAAPSDSGNTVADSGAE